MRRICWAVLGLILGLSACSKKSDKATDPCTPRLIRSAGTQTTTYQYDAKGRYKGFSSSATDGVQVELAYDSLSGCLLGVKSINLVRTNPLEHNFPMEALSVFQYTTDGKIGKVISVDFAGNVRGELTPKYEGTRLVALERSGYQSNPLTFAYDARGNLTGTRVGTLAFDYRYTEYDDKPNPFLRDNIGYALHLSALSPVPQLASALSKNNAVAYTLTTAAGETQTRLKFSYNAQGWPVSANVTSVSIRSGTSTTATSTVQYDYECP